MKLLRFISKAIKLLLTELVGQCLLFINRVRGLYCKIQSPRSAVQPELARAVHGD